MILYRIRVQYKNGMPDNRSFWFGAKHQADDFRRAQLKIDEQTGHSRCGFAVPIAISGKRRPSNEDFAIWLTDRRID